MQGREKVGTILRAIVPVAFCVLFLAPGCAPPRMAGKLTIANLAGVHFARSAQGDGAILVEDAEKLLTTAVEELNNTEDLDLVILTGNLLHRPQPADLDRLKEILDGLRVPYFVVLGGSDTASGEGEENAVSRSTIIWAFQGHGFSGPEGYWAQQIRPGVVLVGLDTARVGQKEGFVDQRQLEWLSATLKKYADQVVIIIAHHGLVDFHPFDESVVWQHLKTKNEKDVRAVIAEHPNVLLVITGHHHFSSGKAVGPVVYISNPSLTVWPLAYQLIRLTPKSAETLWLPVGNEELQVKAQNRLLADEKWRGPFPEGEKGDTDALRLFGGQKSQSFNLITIRP